MTEQVLPTETPTGESTTLPYLNLMIQGSMTTPTRPGKQPRPVWEVTGITTGLEEELKEIGGRRWRGTWSFWNDPTEAIAKLTPENRLTGGDLQDYREERSGLRAERLQSRAIKQGAESTRRFNAARSQVAGIPFGQPVLTEHYSAKKHLGALKRHDSHMRKGCEAFKAAQQTQAAADSAARNAIGEYSRIFVGNRINDAEKELRRIARDRKKYGDRPGYADQENMAKAKLEHWQAYWDEQGWINYGKDNVARGDWIEFASFGWFEVLRSNAKSATITGWGRGNSSYTVPWHECMDRKTVEQWAELQQSEDYHVAQGAASGFRIRRIEVAKAETASPLEGGA